MVGPRVIPFVMLAALAALVTRADAAGEKTCLYVSSYHAGYHWNDRIEAGLTESLDGACRLERFYMDTKRHPENGAAMGGEAAALIEATAPDVIVACDDNAQIHLVVPFLKGGTAPVVFCGVNWTAEEYGYPAANVTGMIEVAPSRQVLREAKDILGQASTVAFLSADVLTQHKEAERLRAFASELDLTLDARLVSSMDDWRATFDASQDADILVLGNPAGIADWDAEAARRHVLDNTRTLTTAFGVAMSRMTVFAMTNVPEEQGQWAGGVARMILAGTKPAAIPIVPNRTWRLFTNRDLARAAGVTLPEHLQRRTMIGE